MDITTLAWGDTVMERALCVGDDSDVRACADLTDNALKYIDDVGSL
jgi:hypothetical protein